MSVLTAEQLSLRDSVRALLAKRADSAAVRKAIEAPHGFDEALWTMLCEQIGVAALSIPEKFGGLGASLVESHIVLDELGRVLAPTPLLGSAVFGGHLLLATGDDEACARLLPAIASGESIAAVCWAGPAGRWEPAESAVIADITELTGTTCYVLDGDVADVLLVVARDADGPAIFVVDPTQPAVVRRHTPAMDPTRRLAEVSFERAVGVRIDGDAMAALRRANEIACVALSAEQVGGMSRALEMTVDYSKLREQFGRPIGSFQALKHRMADLHVLVETARSASYAAVSGTVAASVAKAYCSEAYFTVAAEAIQLHGGIAITWEHDAHLYFKRAHGSAQLFGAPSEHVARLAGLTGIDETEERA